MESAIRQPASSPEQAICPYLGLKHDPQTCLRFPSHANYCQQAVPPRSVRLQYQTEYCQSLQHTQCVVFRRDKRGPLPADIRGRRFPDAGRRGGGFVLPLLLTIAVIAGGLAWLGNANGVIHIPALDHQATRGVSYGVPSPTTKAAQPTGVVPTPVPALAPLLAGPTSLPTSTETVIQPTYSDPSVDTPTPVSTAEGWCGHQLDEPFGSGTQLIIHKVGGGDSLNRYEIVYRTSVEAIEGVNLPFRIPVPLNTVLVIPLDTTKPESLPVFEPVQVSERNTSIQTMAFKVKADLLAFEEYNDFDQSCRDFIGWVVAPRERPSP